jgi:hypothetical protein
MTEERTPYELTPDQKLHDILERRLLAPYQVAHLLDDGSLALMESRHGVQITLGATAASSLLDLLYNHRDLLYQASHQVDAVPADEGSGAETSER